MSAYINYFKLRFITNLQYRVAAIAGILTQLFFGFVFIFVFYAFYESNGDAALPMKLSELITYVWLQQAFYSLIYPSTKDKELLQMIKNGDISYELIRPQNFFVKFYVKAIANRLSNVLLRSFPVIIIAILLPSPFNLKAPASITSFLLFAISLVISCLMISCLNILIHFITIFTIDSRGTFSLYTTIIDLMSGNLVPIPFLPKILITVSKYLPFQYICDMPFRIYSGSIPVLEGLNLIKGSLIWIIILIFIGEVLSYIILRKAVINGG